MKVIKTITQNKAADKLNKLYAYLLENDRIDDAIRVSKDKAYCRMLLDEFYSEDK